jgi:hypothetical protein
MSQKLNNTETSNQFFYDFNSLINDNWDDDILYKDDTLEIETSIYESIAEKIIAKSKDVSPETVFFIAATTVINNQENNIGRNGGWWYFTHPLEHFQSFIYDDVMAEAKDIFKVVYETLEEPFEEWGVAFDALILKGAANEFTFDVDNNKIIFAQISALNYSVRIHTHTVDNEGKRINNSQEIFFKDENPLAARTKAIAKAKELLEGYSNNPDFASPGAAAANGYKNYSAFSINLIFSPDVDSMYDNVLYGDGEEETKESLLSEAYQYDIRNINYDSTLMETEDGDEVDVLADDFEFLMS